MMVKGHSVSFWSNEEGLNLVLVMGTDWDGMRAIQAAGNTVFYLSGGCMGADIC